MRVLVTGAAGFIGFNVVRYLLARGDTVLGIDNINDYYNPELKRDRLAELVKTGKDFTFVQVDFLIMLRSTQPLTAGDSIGSFILVPKLAYAIRSKTRAPICRRILPVILT